MNTGETIVGAVDVYVSDFGTINTPAGFRKLKDGTVSRFPDWFNRVFRPRFWKALKERRAEFEAHERALKAEIQRIWDESK